MKTNLDNLIVPETELDSMILEWLTLRLAKEAFNPKGKRKVEIQLLDYDTLAGLGFWREEEYFCLIRVIVYEPKDLRSKEPLVLGLHNDKLNIGQGTFIVGLQRSLEPVPKNEPHGEITGVWIGSDDLTPDGLKAVDDSLHGFSYEVDDLDFKDINASVEEDNAACIEWLRGRLEEAALQPA